MRRRISCLALLALACSPSSGATPSIEPEAYCAVARSPDLTAWNGDVVASCPASALAIEGYPSGCTHSRVEGGALRELDAPGARLVLGAANGALVIWGEDGALRLRSADGSERELAPWAADPSVGPSGSSVAYLTAAARDLEDGAPRPGAIVDVVLRDLGGGAAQVLARDADASSPVPLPDGSGVLFVSTRTSIAALWRASASGEEQLTNVGMDSVAQGFVPVPSGAVAWIDGTRAAYSDGDRVWIVDTRDGSAQRLGPGRFPRLGPDASILALGGTVAGCAARYPIGGAP